MTAESPGRPEVVYRHRLPVRLTHWLNVVCLIFLLMSGLQIFNAHPALYWGQKGAETDQPWLKIGAVMTMDGLKGSTVIAGKRFYTTGVLGVSQENGGVALKAWPAWATVPSWRDLAIGRRWHFFFAWLFVLNVLLYMIWGFASRHVQKDLAPERKEWGQIGRSIVDHIKLKHPKGEAAKRYNVLQKVSYLAVVFAFLPLMMLTGLTMSPGVNAALPWMLDLFGGRQSARSIHFIVAWLIVLFVIVHLVEVVLAGPLNELRSMITGRYKVPPDPHAPEPLAPEPLTEEAGRG